MNVMAFAIAWSICPSGISMMISIVSDVAVKIAKRAEISTTNNRLKTPMLMNMADKLQQIYGALGAMRMRIEKDILPLMEDVNFPDAELQNELQAVSNMIYRHCAAYEIKVEDMINGETNSAGS